MREPDYLIAFEPADESWAVWIGQALMGTGRRLLEPGQLPHGEGARLFVVYSRQASTSWRIRKQLTHARDLAQRVFLVLVDDDNVSLPAPPFDVIRLTLPDAPLDLLRARLLGRAPAEEPSGVPDPPRSFVNRVPELRALAEAIGGTPVVVTGPPGIGKTALVATYVATLGSDADVQWISAAGASRRRYSADALLVIDGAYNYFSVADTLRVNPQTRAIVTSRSDLWPFDKIRLDELTEQESVELLTNEGLSEADSVELWHRLGGAPGALTRAAQAVVQQPDVLSEVETLEDMIRGAGKRGFYYLDTDDPRVISAFERAFVELAVGIELGSVVHGSWHRLWRRADRAAEVVALARPEGEANKSNAEAIALLMQASAAITNTVICSGSILFVKITDDRGTHVISKTLTPEELRRLEEQHHLLTNPAAAIDFLKLLEAGSV